MIARDKVWNWADVSLLILVQLWVAHAIVAIAHEYGHSFAAWVLGWKDDPLALGFRGPKLPMLVFQMGINPNVDEASIFASGNGAAAAIVAAAGLLGNALVTLPLSRLGFRWALWRGRREWAMLAYWCSAVSIGNLTSYVPLRTFTLQSDMGSVQRGFGWSPWVVILVFGVPIVSVVALFLIRVVPRTMAVLFPLQPRLRYAVAAFTMVVLFGFYGLPGFVGRGPISHILSLLTVSVVMPLAIVLELKLVHRSIRREWLSLPAFPEPAPAPRRADRSPQAA